MTAKHSFPQLILALFISGWIVESVSAQTMIRGRKLNLWTGEKGWVDVEASTVRGILALAGPVGVTPAKKAKPIRRETISWNFQPKVEDLVAPDGMAVHPVSHELYVSEEDACRIRLIRDGRPMTVADAGMIDRCTGEPLRFPEGLAFSSSGDLFVVEDVPGGRLLRIRLDAAGQLESALEVNLPLAFSDFAWESIDVGRNGELLVAGSNAESRLGSREAGGPFSGAVLFRDVHREWWQLERRPLASFSSAVFSRNGKRAVYACELTGSISWADLKNRQGESGSSEVLFKSPESITVLPSGNLLIAEEAGSLVALNPASGKMARYPLGKGTIETVLWDEPTRTLWVSGDEEGAVFAQRFNPAAQSGVGALERARVSPTRTPTAVPDTCPAFLQALYRQCNMDQVDDLTLRSHYKKFVERVPVLSVEAVAIPKGEMIAGSDPIVRVAFAIFYPNQVIKTKESIALSPDFFVAEYASGKVVHTRIRKQLASHLDLIDGTLSPMGETGLQVPCPGAVTVSDEGNVSVNYLGMGLVPDFHFFLNPASPEDSYLMVDDRKCGRTHYALSAKPGHSLTEDLVLSYSRESRQPFQQLATSSDRQELALQDAR